MDIALVATVSSSMLVTALRAFFPGKTVVVSDDVDLLLQANPPDVLVDLFPLETPGFPIGLALHAWPGTVEGFQEMAIALARHLSDSLRGASLCDGSGYGPSDGHYWSIVWRDGAAYLAHDADPPQAPRILHALRNLLED